MPFNIPFLISKLAETVNAMVTLIVVRYEMENLSVIASTEQRVKHAINACHSFMIDPGKEEPKKILTNVSDATAIYTLENANSIQKLLMRIKNLVAYVNGANITLLVSTVNIVSLVILRTSRKNQQIDGIVNSVAVIRLEVLDPFVIKRQELVHVKRESQGNNAMSVQKDTSHQNHSKPLVLKR
jgi:hypothetical protein